MDREKIAERFRFTEEEENEILKKSGGVCAHCGKPVFYGYGLTIDHYIPLGKGGTNRKINLIPMCRECNKEKSDNIIPPDGYLEHLKPEYRKELDGYYDSYIHSFNYFNHNNFLAEDKYVVSIPLDVGKGKWFKNMPDMQYTVQKATYEDLDDLYEYYVRYLKKHDCLDGRDFAKKNILEWYENDCIYFVRKNGEIKLMAVYCITDCNLALEEDLPEIKKAIRVLVFPYYVRPETGTLCQHVLFYIPDRISKQQKLDCFPVMIDWLYNETIPAHIRWFANQESDQMCEDKRLVTYVESYGKSFSKYTADDINKINDFFSAC